MGVAPSRPGRRSLATLRRRAAELSVLNAVSRAQSSSFTPHVMLERVLQAMLATLHLHTAGAILIDWENSEIEIHTAQCTARGQSECTWRRISLLPDMASHEDPAALSLQPLMDMQPPCGASLVAAPIIANGRALGLLSADLRSAHHPPQRMQRLLAEIGRRVGAAIANARLYEQARQDAERLAAANAAASAVTGAANQTLEISVFLQAALTQIVAAAALRGASVLLLDLEQASLTQAAYHGDMTISIATLGQQSISLGHGSVGNCAATGKPIWKPGSKRSEGSGPRALAYLPLQAKGRLLGILVAASRQRVWDPAGADLLRTFAGQVALGLANALLYREAEQHAADLAAANNALREAMRARDQILANVTHELKRPLAPVRLVLETLLESPPGRLSPQRQEKLLRNALNNLDNMHALVTELIDAVRLPGQGPRPAQTVLDLRVITRRSLAALQPIADARHIQVHSIIPQAAVKVCGDPRALSQVVANLLSNAVKFNKEAGSILVQLERTPDDKVVLSVTDTGIGIPSSARPHIFERFYQADSSSSRKHEGLGLGLFIAREIVERHGGQIRFDSEEGIGTTFTVVLPLA